MDHPMFFVSVKMEEFMLCIEDIYFFEVNTKYISSSVLKN